MIFYTKALAPVSEDGSSDEIKIFTGTLAIWARRLSNKISPLLLNKKFLLKSHGHRGQFLKSIDLVDVI